MALTTPRGPVQRFTWIITVIQRALGQRADRRQPDALPGPFLLLVWTRIQRLANRFVRLVEKIEAGTLPPPRRPGAPRPRRPRPPPDPARRLPRGHAWLVRLGRHEAANAGSLLGGLLADPDMAALLEAEPRRLGRVLRPLCRMLGVTPPPLIARPPPKPALAAVSPPAAGTPHPTPDPIAADPAPRPRRKPPPPRAFPTACGPPPVTA